MDRGSMRVCHECMSLLRQPKRASRLPFATSAGHRWSGRSFVIAAQSRSPRDKTAARPASPQITRNASQKGARSSKASPPTQLSTVHQRIFELTSSVLKPEDHKLPSEQRLLYVLEQLDTLAKGLLDTKSSGPASSAQNGKDGRTATSALLGSVNARQHPGHLNKASLLSLISEKAEELLRNPTTFITPAILKSYVGLQTNLHQPSSLPDIFALYASKPAPKLSSDGGVAFTEVSPDKVNAAIDAKTANIALSSAIDAHNLPLCIDIIDTSFGTLAFRKSKGLRQALFPFAGLLLAPGAAYALSTAFGNFQNSMDPGLATGVAFAGIMTYVFTVTGLGYVVITTANDQMDRVTWARGVPLWERWVREEERAALDRVAGAWGFKDARWRGTEEGAEWVELREVIGRKGMALDKVELMEGME